MQKTRVVCVGGGHCNVQVLKQLKKILPDTAKLTLVTDAPRAFYSGMLPGAVSKLYTNEEIQIHLEPLAKWCNAEYIEKKVEKIVANQNKIELADGSALEYDILVVNVGSKTRSTDTVKGIWEHSLSTRPINFLLSNIVEKEEWLLKNFIIPELVVCGSGAAGVELAFGYKERWSKLFGCDVKVTIVSATDSILKGAHPDTIKQTMRKLEEKKISLIRNERVTEIKADCVEFQSGNKVMCNVSVWATGADPQVVNLNSDLELTPAGYFRVNDFLQSVSHPNVFAGGDCIQINSYEKEPNFPPKAGVYAVREGPIIADNLVNFIKKQALTEYIPQRQFLALMMTGDGKAIGAKFGIAMVGKWVWEMKDFIDRGFMKLFDPNYLFNDYKTKGTAEPLNNNELFDEATGKLEEEIGHLRARAKVIDPVEAGQILSCGEEETDFHLRLMILSRMHFEKDFEQAVVANFNPPYYQ